MDAAQLLELLPWRQPFLMIDRMLECEPHRRILTRKNVTASDALLGEGQNAPVFLPRVMLLEGMAQSAALLFRLSYPDTDAAAMPMLGFLSAKLPGTAAAGEIVEFDVQSTKMTRRGGVFRAQARRDDTVLAEAELAFSAAAPEGRDS